MLSTIGYYVCIPFAALLRLFYSLTTSYGVSLILFTLVIKLILLPFQMKSKKSMVRMSRMSGKTQEIQKKYANNQAKAQEEIQKLYAEQGVNPMSGCLWSILPMFFLIALYAIIRQPITHFMMLPQETVDNAIKALQDAGIAFSGLTDKGTLTAFGQIQLVNTINTQLPAFADSVSGWIKLNYSFLGIDLSTLPTTAFTGFVFSWAQIGLILIPVISAVLSFVVSKISMTGQPTAGAGGSTTKMMIWMMPLMSLWIGFTLPAALGIYWIAQSAFSAIQEFLMGKFYNNKLQEEEDIRQESIESDRKRRQEEAKSRQEEQRQMTIQQQKQLAKKKKAAEVNKAKKKNSTNENGRVGDRPYARGRAYSEDRFADTEKK